MRILLDNVNLTSLSGPNSFARRLKERIEVSGTHEFVNVNPDVQLSFISASNKVAPLALRLDGIYFNTRQDWQANNVPIKKSFDVADLIVYQTAFNKRLTERFFGESRNSVVINNGTDLDKINSIKPADVEELSKFSEVWACSSSWRPHKRLKENINYFLTHAPSTACLVVIGENPDHDAKNSRVLYTGQIQWEDCISIYKRSKVFLHLAFIDHCPNVVVDARASGCNLVIASSGGTREIAGPDALVVRDLEWDLTPLDLYSPPSLNFDNIFRNDIQSDIDIKNVASRYIQSLQHISRNT